MKDGSKKEEKIHKSLAQEGNTQSWTRMGLRRKKIPDLQIPGPRRRKHSQSWRGEEEGQVRKKKRGTCNPWSRAEKANPEVLVLLYSNLVCGNQLPIYPVRESVGVWSEPGRRRRKPQNACWMVRSRIHHDPPSSGHNNDDDDDDDDIMLLMISCS